MLGDTRKYGVSTVGTGPVRMVIGGVSYKEIEDMASWMKTPDDPHQIPAGEPRFGSQCKDSSSCGGLPSKNPGDRVREQRPPEGGASYDRAGGPSGQPTKQIPESQYQTESSEK